MTGREQRLRATRHALATAGLPSDQPDEELLRIWSRAMRRARGGQPMPLVDLVGKRPPTVQIHDSTYPSR